MKALCKLSCAMQMFIITISMHCWLKIASNLLSVFINCLKKVETVKLGHMFFLETDLFLQK